MLQLSHRENPCVQLRLAPAASPSLPPAFLSQAAPRLGLLRPRSSLRARPRRQPPRSAFAAEPEPRRPSWWSERSHLRARGGRAPESRVTPVAPRRRPGPSPPRFRALRFEDACVLLPSASRAARLATRPPVREAFPAAPIPQKSQKFCQHRREGAGILLESFESAQRLSK